MAETYITTRELVAILQKVDPHFKNQDLIDIEIFFDSIPDDEWELNSPKDYRIVCKASGLREYTASGAYTIAQYLEKNKQQGFWQRLKEWFLHTKRTVRRAFIKKHILDNCSSLVKRNGRFFISRSDTVAIFKTKSNYLTKMMDHTQKTDRPLIKGEDYEDFVDGGGIHFSLSGIYKLSRSFEQCQTKKNRQEWCGDVGEVIQPQIEDIVKQILDRDKKIQKAKDKTKKRDSNTCRVTNQKTDKIGKLKLAAHHLYSQNEYPHLCSIEDNLITLAESVHDQFHQEFMGGTNKPCTIDDFINFVHQYYPSNSEVVIWLQQQKLILGNPQPSTQAKSHVLRLPASQFR